jgi:hypothetical protein
MIPSNESRRAKRRRYLAPEVLESRVVMSSGQGSTLAIMPGSVATTGQISTLAFEISPTLFTPTKTGKVVLGLDVAPAVPKSSSTSTSTATTFKPQIVSITSADGHVMRAQHLRYDPAVARANNLGKSMTSAAVFTVPVPATGQPAAQYTAQIKGLGGTTGQYLLGFYLPGDIAGTGTVTKADIQTIRSLLGKKASSSKYNFEADINRDGVINGQDLKIAQQNLGASTEVSPVVSVNLDPASDPAADRKSPFSTVHFAGQATPGASVTFVDQAGGTPTTTTVGSTGNYSIIVPLVTGSNTFQVTTHDGFGQSISGAISPVVYSPPSSTTPGSVGTKG